MSRAGRQPFDEHDASWRRWHMGKLEGDATPGNGERPPETEGVEGAERKAALERQAELRTLREKVTREARATGRREGFDAGHAEGLAKGLAEGREEARAESEKALRETLTPLLTLADEFTEALAGLDQEVATSLAELALATGQQLAADALKARPRQVLELVRALLHTEPAITGKPRLWLHPLDHKLVAQHLGQELEAAGWTLQPDDQLRRGGCRVTSASGELDATWESRWKAISGQLRRRKPVDTGETPPGESSQ